MPRPVSQFRNFVGHTKQVDLLRRQIVGSKSRSEPFPTTLVVGPSGVGKTQLAQCLADEFGTSLTVVNGHATSEQLVEILENRIVCDFVFIDECHRLKPRSQELLFHVIDESKVPVAAQGGEKPVQTFTEVPSVTLLFASDQPGRLLNALHKRMELIISLGYYSQREMRDIVDLVAANLNLLLTAQAANQLARVSSGIPRRAKHHLLNLRRYFPDAEKRKLRIGDVQEFLRAAQIDSMGLGKTERMYLRFLAGAKKASLDSSASHLGLDSDYVRNQIEPVLNRAGLIAIGSGGRRLTAKGNQTIRRQDKRLNQDSHLQEIKD